MTEEKLSASKPEAPHGEELERAAREATQWNPNVYRGQGQFGAMAPIGDSRRKRLAWPLLLVAAFLFVMVVMHVVRMVRGDEGIAPFEAFIVGIYFVFAVLAAMRGFSLLRPRKTCQDEE